MALDYAGVLNRLVVIGPAALLAGSRPPNTVHAKPYFWHVSEQFPYFTNRAAPWTLDENSEDIDVIQQDFVMRLVIGHLASGYNGERDEEFNLWLPQLMEYVSEREWLQSPAYPTKPVNLTRARLVNGTGYTAFRNSAVGNTVQIGTELTIRCEFDHDIQQVYA